jgi:hypothetical protein
VKFGENGLERDLALLFLKLADMQKAPQRVGDCHGYTAAAMAARRLSVS